MKWKFEGSRINYRRIGKFLGGGAEGEVYAYGRGQALKIVDGLLGGYNRAAKIYGRLSRFKRVARIDDFGKLRDGDWYVLMERLRPLGLRRRKIVNDFASFRDSLNDFERGSEERKFFEWVYGLRRRGLIYCDLHGSNVMEDGSGKMKICDLDGFDLVRG